MADAKDSPVAETEVKDGANVEKIREILFGGQMRDYEKRFVRMEERFAKAADSLREDMKKRLDALESFMQQEFESLGQRLKNEKSERSDALKELAREMRDLSKTLEKKISQVEDQTASGHADLRSRLLDQSKQLSGDLGQLRKEVSSALDREVQTLRSEKTDREALADLFNELALRLKGDLKLPEE